jgi:chromate reductase
MLTRVNGIGKIEGVKVIKKREDLMKILFMVGSLRKGSFNEMLAKNLERVGKAADSSVEFEYADLNLPLFNQDNFEGVSGAAKTFRDQVAAADVVILVTPEYNRSTSGVMKNAIDWAAFYMGALWGGKKVAVAGATPSPLGTAMAQYDIKRILAHAGADVMQQPEIFVANAFEAFDDKGQIKTDEFIEPFMKAVLGAAGK